MCIYSSVDGAGDLPNDQNYRLGASDLGLKFKCYKDNTWANPLIGVNDKKYKPGALQVTFLALKIEIVLFSPVVPFF